MIDSQAHRNDSSPPIVGAVENAVPLNAVSPISALLSKHIFQDGEIVELAVRPSTWWIVFSSWRSLLAGAAIVLAGLTFGERLPGNASWYIEVGILLGLCRLMWATVKWMARIHVLTNMRVLTLSGVFNVTATECPLRRLARVREITPLRERLLLLGTIELIPIDEHFPILIWQTLRHPDELQRKIRAAIERAHQGPKPQ